LTAGSQAAVTFAAGRPFIPSRTSYRTDAGGIDAGGIYPGGIDAGGIDAGGIDAGVADAGAPTPDAGRWQPRRR
jgi:hypothetical protein